VVRLAATVPGFLALGLIAGCADGSDGSSLPDVVDIGRWGDPDGRGSGADVAGPEDAAAVDGAGQEPEVEPEIAPIPYTPPDGMQVVAIDVGQGDSILVRFPAGSVMLVDGGTKGAGKASVVPYLKALHVEKVDYVVPSHPDADHCGGLLSVVESFEVGQVWENGQTADTYSWWDFSDAVDAKAVPRARVQRGDVYTVDGCPVTVLNADQGWGDTNNNSVVLLIECEGARVLLTGDTGTESQEDMVAALGASQLAADAVKVAHHGSWDMYEQFPAAVHPEAALCSVGKWNEYGHPVAEIIAAWQAVGAVFYRTDQNGDIVMTAKDGSMKVVTQY